MKANNGNWFYQTYKLQLRLMTLILRVSFTIRFPFLAPHKMSRKGKRTVKDSSKTKANNVNWFLPHLQNTTPPFSFNCPCVLHHPFSFLGTTQNVEKGKTDSQGHIENVHFLFKF